MSTVNYDNCDEIHIHKPNKTSYINSSKKMFQPNEFNFRKKNILEINILF